MYENLPDFVKQADFCITLKGAKYAYDPFKGYKISALDPFYPFAAMVEALTTNPGANLGIKVGSAQVSAIDIDNCFADGELNEHALDIIKTLDAYTEFSPSGNGVRILFKTNTRFDIEKYYVKNSALGIEYYDAVHCSTVGARMVRLSGNVIHPGNSDLVDTAAVLNKYMKRPVVQNFRALEEATFHEGRALVLSYLANVLPEFYEYNTRIIDYKSESEWDLSMVNMLSAYTDSRAEIDFALRRSRYFLTKDTRHLRKWDKPSYVDGTYSRIGADNQGGILRTWLDAFDSISFEREFKNPEALTAVLETIGIIKVADRSNTYDNLSLNEILGALVYCAEKNITARVWRDMKRKK